MTFADIMTAVGSYAFPIVVTIYLLYERANYIKDQTRVMSDLKETVSLLNDNLKDIKAYIEGSEKNVKSK